LGVAVSGILLIGVALLLVFLGPVYYNVNRAVYYGDGQYNIYNGFLDYSRVYFGAFLLVLGGIVVVVAGWGRNNEIWSLS
jgi:hypothetical protein